MLNRRRKQDRRASEYLRGYIAIARCLVNRNYTAASIKGFSLYAPVNDFQRGMADALLDSVGC